MTRLRITKLLCLHCRGTGVVIADLRCPTCHGEKRVPVEQALRHAVQQYKLSNGGFLSGDYGADIRHRMQRDAAAVFSLAGETPPWLETGA